MAAPRLDIDLDKIHHNARVLVERLGGSGLSVMGVTKSTLGSPEIAAEWLRAGVVGLGDSRIENLEGLRRAGVPGRMTLIRSPMLSQADRVVASADCSFNTELDTIRRLSAAALSSGRVHGVVLMIELGDLREGILPQDVEATIGAVVCLPHIVLEGLGANLACRSGVVPDARNMGELSDLAASVLPSVDHTMSISGGSSSSLEWAFNHPRIGRITELRLGESLLLGREALHRREIPGLHSDAITLVGEVIESKEKPSLPWGDIAQAAFGEAPPRADRGTIAQTIVALGHQDTDPSALEAPPGLTILGASSDHLILDSANVLFPIGAEVRFKLGYSALVRSMTCPFVARAPVRSGVTIS